MKQKEKSQGSFNSLGVENRILSSLQKKGFKIPTPIQHQVIPDALKGKDVVGIAQTGTGKTLAFGIPMLQSLLKRQGQGLVVVPTRELALQVEQSLNQIGGAFNLRTVSIIGGASQFKQVNALQKKPGVIIATPGRLVDLMEQGLCKLDRVNVVTLDEADRMLDVGFLPQIKQILKTVPKNRQTMLFSATMPKQISKLASEFMKIPLRIEITPQGTSSENTQQEVFVIHKSEKMRLVDSLLNTHKDEKILIFSRTKYGVKKIARDIRNMDHTATEIHSNRTLAQRKKALDGFKNGTFRILVATDIAARGIDVQNISLVINFDLPDCLEDYVHRIGRTGRAGRSGKAISFVTQTQKADIRKIEKMIRKSIPILDLPELPPARKSDPVRYNKRNYRRNNFSNKNSSKKFNKNKNKRRRRGGRRRSK